MARSFSALKGERGCFQPRGGNNHLNLRTSFTSSKRPLLSNFFPTTLFTVNPTNFATGKRFFSTNESEQPIAELKDSFFTELSTEFGNVETTVVATEVADPKWYQIPLAGCQSLLEGIHGLGLPWWGTIIASGFIARTILFPFHIKSLHGGVAAGVLSRSINELKKEIAVKMANGEFATREEARLYEGQAIIQLYKTLQINPFRPLLYILIQAPVFTIMFFTLKRMATVVPEFTTGGAGWFLDLSATDPYYILPVMMSALFFSNFEMMQYFSKKYQKIPPTNMQIFMKKVLRAMGLLMIPITVIQPTAVLLYWVTNNAITNIFTLALRSSTIRNIFNFPETVGLGGVQDSEQVDLNTVPFVPKVWKEHAESVESKKLEEELFPSSDDKSNTPTIGGDDVREEEKKK